MLGTIQQQVIEHEIGKDMDGAAGRAAVRRARSILVAGAYDPAYPRNNVILEGCRSQGLIVSEIRTRKSSPFLQKRRIAAALRHTPIEADCVLVPFSCHHEMPVVRRFTTKPILFDPLISRYMTKILDMKKASRYSVHAWINHQADKRALQAADRVFADTIAHADYFGSRYRIPAEKFVLLRVGYNEAHFYPKTQPPHEGVVVGFYGSMLPLHGIETIMEAAGLLADNPGFRFEIIGAGSTHASALAAAKAHGATNVRFLGWQPYETLNDFINSWDICLGIFGATLKASLVIPNKVFHYSACGRPTITLDTPAIREVFAHEKSMILCKPGGKALAEAIQGLVENTALRDAIAGQAHAIVSGQYTQRHIGMVVAGVIEEVLHGPV